MSQTIIKECEGWTISAYEQVHIPPFLRYVAIARRTDEHNVLQGFNVEGHSLKEAIERCKKRIRGTA